jgi:predicted RND superfamily exporter protein
MRKGQNPIKKSIDRYSKFASYNPWTMILVVVLISTVAIYLSQNIQVKSMEYKNMLPDDIEVIEAMNLVSDNFGGTQSAMIAIEIDSRYVNSDEKRDVRDPEVIHYVSTLTQASSKIKDVISVSSASTVLEDSNDGYLPKSKKETIRLSENNPILSRYISKDYTMALVKIQVSDDVDEEELVEEMQNIIYEIPKPAGIIVSPAGEIVTGPIVNALIGPDMAKTSNLSLVGIIVILIVIFRSIRYGLTPLTTIGIGVLWAFGYIGLMKLSMSSATSGVISMIMGIGIDFGIQVSNRFRQELSENDVNEAMRSSLNNVIVPMLTTTLAALIGFKAMTMGQLTFLAEMGKMMSYGITACFLAAITIVPALMVLFEKFAQKRKGKGISLFFKKKNTK